MSLITGDPESSPRDCSRQRHHHHHHHGHGSSSRRGALVAASSTVASLLLLGVILWLTLRPSSPHFSLLAATATLSHDGSVIVIHATFSARNPNAHASALYDELQASASYAGVPLGASAPLEQPAEGDVVMMSALFKSSPWTAAAGTTTTDGLLRTRIQGQLRWKVANWWVSGRHGVAVDCVAVVPSGGDGVVQPGSQCATHVLS